MATLVSDPQRYIADQWENHCGYPSAVLSGIVPDRRHLDNGGYHPSVEDLRRFGNQRDYSNTRPDDRDQNVRYGAAIDMSMSPADMKRCHDRVRRVWVDKNDPRRKYVNAINTWDGSGDAVRLDFYANTAKYASPDHKWHNHEETRRRYLLDWTAAKAIVSILKGESKAQYLASIGQGDDDMAIESTVHGQALMGRVEALVRGYDTVKYGPTKDKEPVWIVRALRAQTEALAAVDEQVAARLRAEFDEIDRAVAESRAEMSARDVADEDAIVAGVLSGLTAEKIAAALPPELAKQVAEELARRLAE